MFSKQSAERFEKDRLIEDPTPGPGAYHLPSAVDGKGAILEVSERWSESAEEEKLESNLSPLSPPFTRTPTPARGRDEKENRVPLSARCGSPRTWSTPATQPTPKKAATPGGWTPGPAVAPGCEDRRQRDLRLASKLDMVRDELRQKSKEAKELQLALTAKDRKIEDLSKKIEELAADRREAHRRTLEAENELCAKRRQLHEKEQEVVALQRKLEHARLARKEWSKHAEKREEEQRNMQNEMLRMQQSVENLQEKLVTSERDQQMAEQTLRQQQRHSSDLEAGFQAHIEVLEEQIARETCRRKDLEERQARDEAERARWDSALKGSERRCEELQGQVLKLEIELKSRVSSETSFTELRTKLEATSSSLQSSEASREELTRQVAKCSQQLQASNEELSSLKTQRAALEDELHRFGETQYLQLQQKVNEAEGQVKALTEDLSKERQQNQGLERKVVDLQDKSTQDVESQRRDRARVEEAEKQLKVLTEELAKEKHQKQALERKVVEVEEKSAYATVERERKERARVEEVEKQVKELTEDLAEERARNEVMERKLNDLEEQERSTRATLETERQERIRDTEICDLEARALRAEAEAEEARQMVERWKEWGDEQQLRELAAETERLERLKQVREDVSQQVEAARRELVAENRALQKRIAELENGSTAVSAAASQASQASQVDPGPQKHPKVSRSLFEEQRLQLQNRCSEMESRAKAAEKKLAEAQAQVAEKHSLEEARKASAEKIASLEEAVREAAGHIADGNSRVACLRWQQVLEAAVRQRCDEALKEAWGIRAQSRTKREAS